MAKVNKREMWTRRIAACERSGKSRRAWCEAHGVNVHTFDYWRYRLQTQSKPVGARRARAKALVPIVVQRSTAGAGSAAAASIEVVLRDGITLRAPATTDARWLATLARELGTC